jgi:hypothetical protein
MPWLHLSRPFKSPRESESLQLSQERPHLSLTKNQWKAQKQKQKHLAGATNNLTGAFIGPQLTAKQLEERMKAFNTQGTGTTKTVESIGQSIERKTW